MANLGFQLQKKTDQNRKKMFRTLASFCFLSAKGSQAKKTTSAFQRGWQADGRLATCLNNSRCKPSSQVGCSLKHKMSQIELLMGSSRDFCQKCPFSSAKKRHFECPNLRTDSKNIAKRPPRWRIRHLVHAFPFSGEYQANFEKLHIFDRFGAVLPS